MGWTFTTDVEAYADAATALLATDPVGNTLALSIMENSRAKAGLGGDLFAWWTDAQGRVTGAASHTPKHPLVLGVVPDEAMEALADGLAERELAGVNGKGASAGHFASLWRRRTAQRAHLKEALRLYALDQLLPAPMPDGGVRLATTGDIDLLVDWMVGFGRDTGNVEQDFAPLVEDRIGYGGFLLWDNASGVPVSAAGHGRIASGVARVGPVYTPPEHRGRGYAAATTAAVTQRALDSGARGVVLFTQLDNPTANALYQRLGYRPVEDRLVLTFDPVRG